MCTSCIVIIDARGASITYGQLGGVVDCVLLCVRFCFGFEGWCRKLVVAKVVYGYVLECSQHDKHGPE